MGWGCEQESVMISGFWGLFMLPHRLAAVVFSLLSFYSASVFSASPLEGLWQTIDDVTGKPRSVIEIKADERGQVNGYIRKVIEIPGVVSHKTCIHCRGDLKDQPIVGLKMMWQMVARDGEWTGGQILDPKSGKIYRCRLRLSEDGHDLEVRGYIGFSWIGRSQTWHRIHAIT